MSTSPPAAPAALDENAVAAAYARCRDDVMVPVMLHKFASLTGYQPAAADIPRYVHLGRQLLDHHHAHMAKQASAGDGLIGLALTRFQDLTGVAQPYGTSTIYKQAAAQFYNDANLADAARMLVLAEAAAAQAAG